MAHDDIRGRGLELAMSSMEEEKRLVYKEAYDEAYKEACDEAYKKACDVGYGGNYAAIYAESYAAGYAESYAASYAEGYEKGYELFGAEYHKCIGELMDAMFEDGRRDEFIAALCDREKEDRLFREYGISPYWLQ